MKQMLTKLYYILRNFLEPLIYTRRVYITSSCKDADYIPKVDDAGKILIENGVKIQVMHNGIKILAGGYHGLWMETIIKNLKGHHEPQEEHVFYQVLKHVHNNATMLELGSYWAYYSLWFHNNIENAKNYLIEPNKNKLELGIYNFELNGYTAKSFNGFIGKQSQEIGTFTDWDRTKHQIKQFSIDDFFKAEDIEFIDLIHSDIQGAEYDMLLGAKRSIQKNKIGLFFISTHGNQHDICLNCLKEMGHKIIAEHTIEQGYAQEGLLVSANPIAYPNIDTIEVSKR